jgi:hypothetical protein
VQQPEAPLEGRDPAGVRHRHRTAAVREPTRELVRDHEAEPDRDLTQQVDAPGRQEPSHAEAAKSSARKAPCQPWYQTAPAVEALTESMPYVLPARVVSSV